jgi:hypothetical protein
MVRQKVRKRIREEKDGVEEKGEKESRKKIRRREMKTRRRMGLRTGKGE